MSELTNLRKARAFRDGEPCDHPGCLSHVSHPCEGCGRIGGYKPLPPELRLHLEVQHALSRAQYENCIRRECLEMAMRALKRKRCYATLGRIEQRLAQLEPEEETG